jgi:uncharacterized protein involved in outer membrane biogenesis
MRKLGIAIVVIIIVIVIALLVAPQFIDVNSYHNRIQAELQSKLERPVTLGQLHLSLIPLKFSADNAAIGDDPRFQTQRPFAQVQKLSVSVALMPLLHKDIQVNSLELDEPKIELIKNAQGVWNFSTLGQSNSAQQPQQATSERQPQKSGRPAKQQPQEQKPASQPKNSGAAPQNISLADLTIKDGQLAVTDEQARQPRQVYDHIDLHLADFAPGKPFAVQAAAHLPGAGNQEISLDGNGGPIDQATPINTPLKAKVTFKNVSIAGFQKYLQMQQLQGDDAVINGTANVENAPDRMASSGNLDLSNIVLHGNQLGFPIAANYSVASKGKLLEIEKGNLKLGDTPVRIAGTVNSQPTPAQIDLSLGIANASLAEIARLAAAQGIAFNPGMNVAGKVSADVHASGAMTKPAMNGTVNATNLQISGKDMPQPVTVDSIHLDLTPTQVSSNNFTAKSGSTTLSGKFTLSQYSTPSPSVDADIATQNANVGELLNIAKAYGVTAAEGMSGSGSISFKVNASGPMKDPNAMVFNGTGQLQNATLKTAQMTQPLKIKNANLKFSQNAANLENLAASVGSTNATGSASVSNFNNPNVKFALNADTVNVTQLEQIFGVQSQSAPQKRAGLSLIPAAEAAPAAPASFLQKATGGGTINVGNILYQDLQLTNMKATAALDHGIIRLNPVTTQIYGGQETGAIVADMRGAQPTYQITSKLANVDANKLLSSVSSVKQTLYGLLGANTNVTLGGGNDIARTLNGTASINLANGKLMHIDLLHELGSIGKFLNKGSAQGGGYTAITQLAGDFNIKDGVATTNNLKAAINGGSLAAQGSADLASEALNMKVTAVLGKALAQQVGGTGIGGYMQTALANKAGELVMPVLVTGTFSHPMVAPDVQEIAKMRLQNILPTTSNPAAGILGNILGKNAAGAQGTQPQGTLQGILSGVMNKQKPGAQQQPLPNGQPQQQQQQQQKKKGLQGILNGILNQKQQNQQQQNPPPK